MPEPSGGDVRPLLDRRLVIVTGKGGTGKTTVAAALGLAGARAGLRVLVTEMGRDPELPELLGAGSDGIATLRIDPFEALAEYLGLQLRMRGLVDLVVGNPGFRQLMNASPGWRELITLGKIWHLEQQRDGDRPLYDLIIVDAPATGHGVTFLDVPRVVVSAVRAGPLRQHTERVEAMLEDPERTLLLPVARAEELPARETAELLARVRSELQIPVDRVVVNGVPPRPYPEHVGELASMLGALPPDLPLEGVPAPPILAACARNAQERYALSRGYVEQIARETALPLVCLPYLADGVRAAGLTSLMEGLLVTPGACA